MLNDFDSKRLLAGKNGPRSVAIGFLLFGLVFCLFLFYPISLVFQGEWKLNQKIDIAEAVVIDFEKMGLTALSDQLKWDRVVPIGTISIRFYAICILLGVLAGYFLALYLAKTQYLAGTIIDRLIIGMIIFGLIGARLFYVAFNWEFFRESPQSVFSEILAGGLAFYGMFLACLIYVWLYCKRFKFNFFEFGDILAPAVLLGQVIGRFGNFFNYEGYGPETSVFWKMYVPATANYYSDLNAEYFHPTFLYEIIPNFILLIFLLWNYNRLTEKRSGMVFGIYAVGYGIIRFMVEFFRLDSLKINFPSSLNIGLGLNLKVEYLLASQIASVALLVFGVVVLIRRNKIIYLKKNMEEVRVR